MIEKEPPLNLPLTPDDIVHRCGGYSKAVDAVMSFGRALWKNAFLDDLEPIDALTGESPSKLHFQKVNEERLAFKKYFGDEFLLPIFLNHLRVKGLCSPLDHTNLRMQPRVFRPDALVREFLGGIRPEHELQYFVMRNITKHYRQPMASQTIHFLHLLARAVNSRSGGASATAPGEDHDRQQNLIYRSQFLPEMKRILDHDYQWLEMIKNQKEEDTPDVLDFFVECCRAVGYIVAHHSRGYISIKTKIIDAEYLISRMFGMPTGISGFDDLFGGGGLILSEDIAGNSSNVEKLNGRTILVMGRFGTGKSLLSMQLAVEVARKGGIGWIVPLEQPAKECLYTLESMAVLPNDLPLLIVKTSEQAMQALPLINKERGALIILDIPKDSFEKFLSAIKANAKVMSALTGNNGTMQEHPLRLISVDPINTISGRDKPATAELRAQMVATLNEIKKNGTNVILVAEAGSAPSNKFLFEQNIADTVIKLSINKSQNTNYAQRYFEITKSRFQREQRGEHAFSIVPGVGFKISPSTAAVQARIYTRGLSSGDQPIEVGPESLDEILGKKAVNAGDVIAFQGPAGTFKTFLGIHFLLGSDNLLLQDDSSPEITTQQEVEAEDLKGQGIQSDPIKRKSLFLATRNDDSTPRSLLTREFVKNYEKRLKKRYENFIKRFKAHRKWVESNSTLSKTSVIPKLKQEGDIIIRPLRYGYVQPGYIFQSIQDEFLQAEQQGYQIDRVLVDNIAPWEMSSPFIRDDETFGITLLEFLKRRRVTTLVICGENSPEGRSVLQRSIIDSAHCVIRFERRETDVNQRVFARVITTRSMQHHQGFYEIKHSPQAITFEKPEEALASDADNESS